ncbi:hypothetical protein Q4601_09050 [Shewanella sp. 1_MG-2023]|uniref:Crp/Fnr family transcriptional regulator n=1 Tax=unclassified Shewanella TaxID=196818 RepID=UPI0026E4146A|nr:MULTISPECIES: hypothetical protein [unclassified Shewanella]MDO6610440.1 hypothetical protein [Shewanella sp. 7_MG-2023]MDO6770565.1 hypothetical protein [Shewanella sp. 2_MG-2023]MDO6794452.1 hypothetical protein [Shewanella sp. 1_MG-2023]
MKNIIAVLESTGVRKHDYAQGRYLLRQSCEVTALLFCVDANFTVSYINDNGNEFILKVEENYTGFVGEMEFFQQENHSLFSVKSNKPGTYYKLSKMQVLTVLSADSQVFSDLMALMTQRYNTNVKKLIERLTQPTKISIINQILQAHNVSDDELFDLSSTLNAKKLGITTRTYRRIVHELIEEKKLEKIGKRYKVIGQL